MPQLVRFCHEQDRVAADGKIRVKAKSIRSLGLPVKRLMKVVGIELDDMLAGAPA
jgi:hypothetical protein